MLRTNGERDSLASARYRNPSFPGVVQRLIVLRGMLPVVVGTIAGGWIALRLTGSLYWLFAALALGLSAAEKLDLVAYLKSL